MIENFWMQAISIVVVVAILSTLLLSKRFHYFVAGTVLVSIGVLSILYENSSISFNIADYPIVQFAAYFMIVFAGKDLFVEGFKEKESFMKYPSMILAIILILVTTLPTLYNLGVVRFAFPQYPQIINSVLYIVSGAFLLVGIFTLLKSKD